jgi:K+-sensing histidine kinase KdpD
MVSRTIVQHVLRRGEGVLSQNAMTDVRFAGGDSVQNFGIHSALCVPIKYKERIFGVIHIDSKIANYTFTEDQLRLLTAIGVHTGLALANAEMYAARLQQERLAAVGQTVASLSHSVKNILQGIRGGADVVEMGLSKNNMKLVRGGWAIVARNLDRIFNLTMNMLAFSKQRKPELEMTSVPMLLHEIVTLMQTPRRWR